MVGRGSLDLKDIVGPVPATINLISWNCNNQASDFTETTFPGFAVTRASITTGNVSGLSVPTQRLVESSASGTHFVWSPDGPQTGQNSPPIPWRLAVIARAAGRTRIVVTLQNFEDPGLTTSAGFDLSGGNVGYDNVVGALATLDGATMRNLGGGWWLCLLDAHYTALRSGGSSIVWQPQINIDNGSGTAARSISYTGDGSSGVDLFFFSMLPKAAWDITNLALYDDFDSLSTIDLADTGAPGFKWYPRNLMPNSFMPTFGWTTNPPSAPSPSSYFSISSPSVLKIYNPNANQSGYTSQMWSVVDDGAGGYIGAAFKGPLVFDGLMYWDAALGLDYHYGGWPAFWSASVEALTGQMGGATHFTEWDIVEAGGNRDPTHDGGGGIHDWSNPTTPLDGHNGGGQYVAPMTNNNFHRFASIWLTTASTGTDYGIYLFFLDGHFIAFSDVFYTTTGDLSAGDTQTMPVLIDTAESVTSTPGGWPMYIDWVKVWNKPT